MSGKNHSLSVLAILLCVVLPLVVEAQEGTYVVDRKFQWEKWTFPKGVVKLELDGRVGLARIRGEEDSLNACLNADEFTYVWMGDTGTADDVEVSGGIKEKADFSNKHAAWKIIDGDPSTWWSPDPGDDLEDWWIEVDLGRAVAASKIRLVFADEAGTEPFRDFSVYVSDGASMYPGESTVEYTLIGRTTRPNTHLVVEYDLACSATVPIITGGDVADAFDFGQVKYVRVILNSKSTSPALAELEVCALGDNIALGTDERGGSLEVHSDYRNGPNIKDGDLTTRWLFPILTDETWNAGYGDDPVGGAWFVWDLGTVFWLDRIVVWFGGPAYALIRGNPHWPEGYLLYTSDGTRTIEGELDYVLVADVYNRDLPTEYNFNHEFGPRRARYLFFRHAHGTGNWRTRANGGGMMHEMQIFGEGYPASVTLTSDFIDLGESKSITRLEWDADIPPGTRVAARSRSGDTMEVVKHWYNHRGKEITKAQYDALPPPMRGEITEEIVLPDWSFWSEEYDWSGQGFLSPSPRRYTQLELTLISVDPEVAPVLNSLSLQYTDPLVRSVVGRIDPESAPADVEKDFTYTVSSLRGYGDTGFDRVLIRVPSPVDSSDVSLWVNGISVSAKSVMAVGDSLVVDLTEVVQAHRVTMQEGTIREGVTTLVVREDVVIAGKDTLALYGTPLSVRGSRVTVGSTRITVQDGSVIAADSTLLSGTITLEGESLLVHNDSVEIGFRCRITANSTLFEAFVGNSTKPGLWQRVDPVKRRATIVTLPSLPDTEDLIGNVSILPEVITPNGDGANDETTIRFSIFKVEKEAKVTIHDLRGKVIRELACSSELENIYRWDGRNESEKVVPPGVYFCQIYVHADVGDQTLTRIIGVVY